MSDETSDTPIEKPLSAAAKFRIVLAASSLVLLFYGFAFIATLLLFLLLACEGILIVAAARFGLAGLVGRMMGRHIGLTSVFLRSFWVRRGTDYRLPLSESDAPQLFERLRELCGKLQLRMPREVWLEMSLGAWVRLKGFTRGSRNTILGIGYDLLAGLNQNEINGVLAHEMVHAKLVQRGFKRWLGGGLNRASRLSQGLWNYIAQAKRTKQEIDFADSFWNASDWLTRKIASQFAAYARQDEFEADRGAAELVGPGPIASSLKKLEMLQNIVWRLPWSERVAQLHSGQSISEWILAELLREDLKSEAEGDNVFDKYSTHPSLRDRLAALRAANENAEIASLPGIHLLARPDEVAEKLIAEIQIVAAQQEQKDSKALRKWSRKARSGSQVQGLRLLALVMVLVSIVGGILGWISLGLGTFWPCALFFGGGGLGVFLYRLGRHRDRIKLPVPQYALLKKSWETENHAKEISTKEIEAKLLGQISGLKGKKRKAEHLIREAYAALERCDYVAAYEAGRLCLNVRKNPIEGMIAVAIGSAAFGNYEQMGRFIQLIRHHHGIGTPSLAWGVGWALLLAHDWGAAEAFIEQALEKWPGETTLLTLLALSQSHRGKTQSAIVSARRACTPDPPSKEQAKLLISLLLDTGFIHEARERLALPDEEIAADADFSFYTVRLNLLIRNFDEAERWTAHLRQNFPEKHTLVRLGQIYEMARRDGRAEGLYQEALEGGYYPEAYFGLGRLESNRRNKEKAQQNLLAALNLTRPLGEKATSPLQLFHPVLGHLLSLKEPVLNCKSWTAKFGTNTTPSALANTAFRIYAPSRGEAESQVNWLFSAMRAGMPPLVPGTYIIEEAEKKDHPDGPVRPGVQGVIGE